MSGVGNSNAGSVRIWSDKDTVFAKDATILARGGGLGGDGGLVEVELQGERSRFPEVLILRRRMAGLGRLCWTLLIFTSSMMRMVPEA